FPDQHFQIIEFANFKLGKIGDEDLAWEYEYRERQALQPLIAYGFIKTFHTLGITEPIKLTEILRILTGLLMVFGLSLFIKATLPLFRPEYRKVYIAASLLIWFIPCYYVHFGSETFSQLLLLLGCAVIFSNKRTAGSLFLIGLLLG